LEEDGKYSLEISFAIFFIQSAVDNEILKPSLTFAISISAYNFKIVTIRILGSSGNPSYGKSNLIS
jgi:hypothetical protein